LVARSLPDHSSLGGSENIQALASGDDNTDTKYAISHFLNNINAHKVHWSDSSSIGIPGPKPSSTRFNQQATSQETIPQPTTPQQTTPQQPYVSLKSIT